MLVHRLCRAAVTVPNLLEFKEHLNNTHRCRVWILGGTAWGHKLDFMTLMVPFQLRLCSVLMTTSKHMLCFCIEKLKQLLVVLETNALKNTGLVGDTYRLQRFCGCIFKFLCSRPQHTKKQDQQ